MTRGTTAALVFGACLAARCSRAPTSAPPAPAVHADAGATARPAAPAPFVDDPVDPIQPSSEMVTIRLVADAKRQAQVFWGRKLLGVAPLEVTRPKGSGPLDLLVVAPGYLPLHTRAFTDRNETLALRLHTDKEAQGLLGYVAPKTE